MSKKVLSIILAAVLVMALIAGCGGGSSILKMESRKGKQNKSKYF